MHIFTSNMKTFQRTLFGGKRDYWDIILPSLKGESFVAAIQTSQLTRTNVGKGRAFIRSALVHKSLGELLQIVSMNTKIMKEFYGEGAILRSEALSARLLDQLYHLSSLHFELDPEVSGLDESWPKPALNDHVSLETSPALPPRPANSGNAGHAEPSDNVLRPALSSSGIPAHLVVSQEDTSKATPSRTDTLPADADVCSH